MSSTAASRRYTLISSDTHAGAEIGAYKPYLDRQYHDEFDAWAKEFHDGWGEIDVEKMDTDDSNVRVGVASFMSPYNWDSDKRIADLEGQGIVAEVLFPNTVPPFYPAGAIAAPAPLTKEEYGPRWAGVKAHNRWLVDFCAAVPGRRAGIAQVFLNDVEDAVREVRWAKEAGLKGILVPGDHHRNLVNLYEPRLDPFWAACQEMEMPVHRHGIVVSDAETAESGPAAPAIGQYECFWFALRGLPHLIIGGVFERFPRLKFVLTEATAAWVPDTLAALDGWMAQANNPGTIVFPFANRAVKHLSMLPSEYFARNCYLGTFLTPADVARRHEVGIDRIMWGADYPHHEGVWPHTTKAMRLTFADVPEEEVHSMTSTVAAEVYDFDLEFLKPIADRIGPSVEECSVPLPPEEMPKNSMCPTFSEWFGDFQ